MYQRRLKEKTQKKDELLRRSVGRKTGDALTRMPDDFEAQFLTLVPNVEQSVHQTVAQYVKDPKALVGQYINHMWDVEGEGTVVYSGKVVECKQPKNKPAKLRVAYWLPDEEEKDAADTNIKVAEALADYLLGDLSFCC